MENEVISLRGLSQSRGLSAMSTKNIQQSAGPQKSIMTTVKAGENETKRRAFGDITNSNNGGGKSGSGNGGAGKVGLGGVSGLSQRSQDVFKPKPSTSSASASSKGLAKMTIFEDGDIEVMHNAKVIPLQSELLMETPSLFAHNLACLTSLERTEIVADAERWELDAEGGGDEWNTTGGVGETIDMDLDF